MDKVIIFAGMVLLWASITDKQAEALKTSEKMLKADGFIGMMVIFAILFSFAQYAKRYEWVASSLAVIIALGLATRNVDLIKSEEV